MTDNCDKWENIKKNSLENLNFKWDQNTKKQGYNLCMLIFFWREENALYPFS